MTGMEHETGCGIYSESMERLEHPDLTLGYLKDGVRTVHHAAVAGAAEVWHYETVRVYENGGRDVRRVTDVPGIPASAAWIEEIPIQIYVPYTEQELARMEAERARPTTEQRIAQLEAALGALQDGLGSV